MVTQAYVLQLIEDRIASGEVRRSIKSIGACHAFAEWIADNWDALTPDDHEELLGVAAVFMKRLCPDRPLPVEWISTPRAFAVSQLGVPRHGVRGRRKRPL